ncbi:hypothetical protein [Agrococcus sp. ProA11]|uniref:hypothetical protein n=1 Tax=Agrococcus chionoecetis TaxID=3153752 RepID=UPI003261A8E8
MDTDQPDEGYRTCTTCGGDCEPEPVAEDGQGVRIAFSCPEHGVQAIVDPFDGLR